MVTHIDASIPQPPVFFCDGNRMLLLEDIATVLLMQGLVLA